MAGFPGNQYAAPGVYTQTTYQPPTQALLDGLRLPVMIGTGSELLTRMSLELIRGSSATADQQIVKEDETGRAVVSVTSTGVITLGAFDGQISQIQVRKYPIVTGNGNGTVATNTTSVSVTVDGTPIVIRSMDAARGLLTLTTPPAAGSEVRVTYFFKRTDTKITENLSEQVTSDSAILYGALGSAFSIVTGDNDTLLLTVDDRTAVTVTIPSSGSGQWTATQIAAFINTAAASTSLVASVAVNNFGVSVVVLTASQNLLVGSGSANSTLGFTTGSSTARNKVFYTFQGPIVDGTNGGVTTTDPSDVVVQVNNVQVIPVAVDGASRAVTLGFAPAAGAKVSVTYYFNAWQDTFDYLADINVTEMFSCGVTPSRTDYTQGVSFVLKDDKIVWGTAALVSSGEHTEGSEYFGESQISPVLVDTRGYLQPTEAFVDQTVSPAQESRTKFVLPLVPTTGNGRNSPLGSSLFQTVANGRIDLPTDRPDLVLAYWGFSVQDALERGPVAVSKVDSATSTITLKSPVPVGAEVFTTIYYNTLVDQKYSLKVVNAAPSGVGTYSIQDESGADLFTPMFGSKSSGLASITLQFPSGSGRKPDVRFESLPYGDTSLFKGAVEENVTVTFSSVDSTLGAFAVGNPGPYYIIANASDHIRLLVDGAALAGGAAGIDLTTPTGVNDLGFAATLVSDEITYLGSTGYTTYDIDATNNGVNLLVDGVLLSASATAGTGVTVANFVTALNTAASTTAPKYTAAGRFLSSVKITASEYDQLTFHYTGNVSGLAGNLTATIAAGTYASVATLAAAVQAGIATQVATLAGGFAGLAIAVTANGDGNLVFALTNSTGDASGYLEFITHATPARDFAVLAGIDTAAATAGSQTKLVDGPIARRFTITGDNTGALLHDRLILRSRLVPGSGTIRPYQLLASTGILVQGSTGTSLMGLTSQDTAAAGWKASVLPASMLGEVGFIDGQIPSATYSDVRDGQPAVTFYAAGGTSPQNNEFKITVDNVPVTVVFKDATGTAIPSGSSADLPLGPATSANTVLAQIRAAFVSAGFSSGNAIAMVRQEGAAIRFISSAVGASNTITIGTANANARLGFSDGQAAERSLPDASQVASALMAHSAASVATSLNTWSTPTVTYFAAEGFAKAISNSAGASYLFLQSQGTSGLGTASGVAFATPTADSVLLPGVGLGVVAGDGATGDAGITGFYVSSSDSVDGSGTANRSLLNPANTGAGQDGVVGQTYRDLVTGLTFTVLPREGGSNYPNTESFTFIVRKEVLTDSNLPINTIPGLELVVSSTLAVGTGDTGIVETFERGGDEPAIGDLYYVSYNYRKDDFATRVYTKFAQVEAEYGVLSPDNPVTLAAYLAILNGAVLVGIKQVQKDTDTNGDSIPDVASVAAYRSAVDDLENALPGGALPDILVPLRGDSLDLFQYITRHADIQSSIRYRQERTVVAGVSAGTLPKTAGNMAQSVQRDRFRMVYPDIFIVPLPRASGPDEEVLADGTFLAAMLVGSIVSPNTDVATPWTGRRLVGGTRLARILDAVEQNLVAQQGVTVLEDRSPVIRVRQGFTSDMIGASTNGNPVLSKLPTIAQIRDEVQKQTRVTLERFIGSKFLTGILSQVEGQLANTLKLLVDAQIITAYTGVTANVSATDATAAEVEAYYSPVFPLLYLLVTFNMRSAV